MTSIMYYQLLYALSFFNAFNAANNLTNVLRYVVRSAWLKKQRKLPKMLSRLLQCDLLIPNREDAHGGWRYTFSTLGLGTTCSSQGMLQPLTNLNIMVGLLDLVPGGPPRPPHNLKQHQKYYPPNLQKDWEYTQNSKS